MVWRAGSSPRSASWRTAEPACFRHRHAHRVAQAAGEEGPAPGLRRKARTVTVTLNSTPNPTLDLGPNLDPLTLTKPKPAPGLRRQGEGSGAARQVHTWDRWRCNGQAQASLECSVPQRTGAGQVPLRYGLAAAWVAPTSLQLVLQCSDAVTCVTLLRRATTQR